MTTTKRVLQSLRKRVLGGEREDTERSPLDEAALLDAHRKALSAADEALSATQTAGATATQQRGALDAAADNVQLLGTRVREARGHVALVRDELDRIKLIALNAALEGSRAGEDAGRPLVTLGEEVRSLVARATDALEEHVRQLEQSETERDQLSAHVDAARGHAHTLADGVLRAQAAQRQSQVALTSLGGELERTARDPELVSAAAAAAEHARGLLAALSTLSTRRQGSLVLRALRPTIRPLAGLLRDLDSSGDDER